MTSRIHNDEFGCRICMDTGTNPVDGAPCNYCCKALAIYSREYLELKTIAQLQRDNPTMLVILENMA